MHSAGMWFSRWWQSAFALYQFRLEFFLQLFSDPEIRANVYKSLLLNLLSLTSIYTFDLLLQPLVHDQPKWLHRNIGWFYQILWLLPVVGLSLYLNVSFCLSRMMRFIET